MKNQGNGLSGGLLVGILFFLFLASPYDGAQTLTVLHSFTNSPDGAAPYIGGSMLILGNTLFGTTSGGGSFSNGTVFSVNTDGSNFSILHHFTGGSDGAAPPPGLTLCGIGNTLYGTTLFGGTNGSGVIYSLNTNGSNF